MKTKPPAPVVGAAAAPNHPVAPKKTCPDFEAGFLHVESVAHFGRIDAAVKALKPTQSIYTDLPAPQKVLAAEAYHYVNLPSPDDTLRDKIPGTNEIFRADRMGRRPRILVRFKEKKSFKFKLELVPSQRNIQYYSDEEGRNTKFAQVLKGSTDYQTNADGYLVIQNLALSAAGGNTFTIKVEVTEPGYEGILIKTFETGVLKTARYLWMLPVIGGDNTRWVPQHSHSACMAKTISVYNDVFIHINNTRFKAQSFKEMEYLLATTLEDWATINGYYGGFLSAARDIHGRPYPRKMKNFIFISVMTRFAYTREIREAGGPINSDGSTIEIEIKGSVVEPIPVEPHNKPYLLTAKGYYFDLASLSMKEVDLRDCTRAIDGINKDGARDINGHIACQKFEIDTSRLLYRGVLFVFIEFNGVVHNTTAGAHWGDTDNNLASGYFFFSTQYCGQYGFSNYDLKVISCVSSHELGHACQMTSKGNLTKPNAVVQYYDNDGPRSYGQQHRETRDHRGPHCKTGFSPAKAATKTEPAKASVHGSCLMFGGASPANQKFCSVTNPLVLAALILNKKNDCTMAVRKVSLDEPFAAYR